MRDIETSAASVATGVCAVSAFEFGRAGWFTGCAYGLVTKESGR